MKRARCELCNNEIEVEDAMLEKEVDCPWCASTTRVIIAPDAVRASQTNEAKIDAAISGSGVTWAYLASVRSKTCYKTLRTVIAVAFGLIYLGVALMILAALMSSFVAPAPVGGAIGMAALVFLVGVFAVAFHQASLILVDIADTLIEQGSRNAPR